MANAAFSMIRSRCRELTLAFLLLAGSQVDADTIPTLYNTGVDSHGVVLTTQTDGPTGVFSDPHYVLRTVPSGTTQIEVYNYDQWLPIGLNPVSAWIAPNESTSPFFRTGESGPQGDYDYRTTFDLSGFNPSTALITGHWAADNNGIDILINGISTGQHILPTDAGNGFLGFTPFHISSGFSSGLNTLDFIVRNFNGPGDNPTGLRVEFLSATANSLPVDASPTPEPAALLLVILGAISAAVSGKKFRGHLGRARSTAKSAHSSL